MNWITFTITAYIVYAMQLVLKDAWGIQSGQTTYEPMLLLTVLVFIGLNAPAITVAWAAVVLGLLVDIFMQKHETGLIGPWALGFLAAGYALVQMRNLLFRDSMFTIGIMTLVAGVFALLVATMLQAMRGIPILGNEAVVGFRAADQLFHGFFMLLYTTVLSVPFGFLLLKMRELWGFSGRGMR